MYVVAQLRMMVVWTLLLTLLVMSDGTIVRKEVNECKCEGDDHSEVGHDIVAKI